MRGEERPRGSELGDPSFLGVVALDLVLHGNVAGYTGGTSRISPVTHGGIFIYQGYPPCSRAVCNLIHMVMRARAIGKVNLGNAEAPILTAG